MKYTCRRALAAAFLVALIVFSCDRPVVVNPATGLSMSPTTATVDFDATSTVFTIVASVDWTLSVTEGGDWITPSVTAGEASSTTKVGLVLEENTGEKPRSGLITITAAGENNPYTFSVTQNSKNTLTSVNKWIFETLQGWYYWNDAVKAITNPPANSLAHNTFLKTVIESLPWSSVQDRSNGENPATIDGEWNKTLTGREDIYSYIERFPAGTRAARGASNSFATTFGFDFQIVTMLGDNGNPNGYYQLLVLWVREGSPAANAGLERGMWITKYNGDVIDVNRMEKFWNQVYFLEGGTQMGITVDVDNNRTDDAVYSFEAVGMRVSPILHHEVIQTDGGKKVAYLFYNAFETGDGGEFDKELRNVFGEFKAAGATELVLDLRYNLGGYVSSCQLLTSLAADVGSSATFIQMVRNKDIKAVYNNVDNPQILKFLNESNSLDLKKVYVLATRNSASASEMAISSLRGVDIEVVHIGARTNGKNVGMDLLSPREAIGGYTYEMRPITFKVLNAKGFTDYADGFEPDYAVNEFRDALTRGGVLYELGDPEELLLKAALTHIDGGRVIVDGQTRTAADAERRLIPSPANHRRGGAIYIPDTQQ